MLTPSELKQLCSLYGIVPSKKYGQNFLISNAPIEKMISAAGVIAGDTIIEIGPGFGILTFALAQHGARVIAFEIEKRLQPYWEEKLNGDKAVGDSGSIKLIWGNALDKLKVESVELNKYKVIANLPYQITSHVLRTLLEFEDKPQSITVMVQKEVAQRIVALPGDMSVLAVSVQYYGKPKIVCSVPRGNFWPAPEVDSAVIHIDVYGEKLQNSFSDEQFFNIVKMGFANKRKQLWKNLRQGLSLHDDIVKQAVFDTARNEKARAQELSVEQWITLVSILHKNLPQKPHL